MIFFLPPAVFAQEPTVSKRPDTPVPSVPPAVGVEAPPPEVTPLGAISADEAVRIALSNQPTLAQAIAALRQARGNTRQTESGLRPTVTLGAGYTRVEQLAGLGVGGGGLTNAGGFGGARSSLILNQLLFDFQRTRDAVRQNRALESVAREGIEVARQTVATDVRTRYADLAQAIRLVTVAEDDVANRRNQLAAAHARLDVGLGAPGDVVLARASLANAIVGLEQARADAETARTFLAAAIGLDPRTPVDPSPVAPPERPDPAQNDLVAIALRERPEVRSARATVVAADLGVSVARRTSAPSFNVSLGASGRGDQDPFGQPQATLGLSLSFPLVDGGLQAGRTEAARGFQEAALAQLRSVEIGATGDVARALIVLRTARQRAATAEEAEANSREAVRIADGRYRGGLGTFQEIIDAQGTLVTARRNLEIARADVSRALALLDRAIGRAAPSATVR